MKIRRISYDLFFVVLTSKDLRGPTANLMFSMLILKKENSASRVGQKAL